MSELMDRAYEGFISKPQITKKNKPEPPLFYNVEQASAWLREKVQQSRREGIFAIPVNLTPVLGRVLLGVNDNNRVLSRTKIEQYARDAAEGRWTLNGEPMIVAITGELNGGQHRCHAVIKAGRHIVTMMVFGVERDTRFTLDSGMKRTTPMLLGMLGHQHYSRLSRAATMIVNYKNHSRVAVRGELHPTSSEVLEWVEAHPAITESVAVGMAVYQGTRASAGLFGALHYLFSEKSRDDASSFFYQLASGELLEKGDPVYELRKVLLAQRKSRGSKIYDNDLAALAIKAWNKYRAKKKVRSLRYYTSGENKEDYPVPV